MIVFDDPEATRKICDEVGVFFNPQCDHSIARIDEKGVRGGVIFQGFTGASILIHMAGFDPHWMNNDILWATFDYVFVQLKCKKLLGQVPSYNERALAIDLRLGFKIETTVKDVFPDGDLILVSMVPSECRWLKLRPRTIQRGYRHDDEQKGKGSDPA